MCLTGKTVAFWKERIAIPLRVSLPGFKLTNVFYFWCCLVYPKVARHRSWPWEYLCCRVLARRLWYLSTWYLLLIVLPSIKARSIRPTLCSPCSFIRVSRKITVTKHSYVTLSLSFLPPSWTDSWGFCPSFQESLESTSSSLLGWQHYATGLPWAIPGVRHER